MDASIQKDRIISGGVIFTPNEFQEYLNSPDTIEIAGDNIPPGYKRCGRCKRVKKYHLFNQNRAALNNCSGNCKECQREAAHVSYGKTKSNRNYKKYYAENKEKKLEANKRYYENHKDERTASHEKYRNSAKGKRVMKKAHNKRKAAMSLNAGIPWTKEQIVMRDRTIVVDGDTLVIVNPPFNSPLCILCGKPIEVERDIQMEHLIPIALGGSDCFTNVGCAHTLCNLRKTKDAREIEVELVEDLQRRSYEYIDQHPEEFPSLFEDKAEGVKE